MTSVTSANTPTNTAPSGMQTTPVAPAATDPNNVLRGLLGLPTQGKYTILVVPDGIVDIG
jgi:hypothetical protein